MACSDRFFVWKLQTFIARQLFDAWKTVRFDLCECFFAITKLEVFCVTSVEGNKWNVNTNLNNYHQHQWRICTTHIRWELRLVFFNLKHVYAGQGAILSMPFYVLKFLMWMSMECSSVVRVAAFGLGNLCSNPGWFAVLNSNQKLSVGNNTIM